MCVSHILPFEFLTCIFGFSQQISFSKDDSLPEVGNAVIENKLLSEAVLESIIGKQGVSPGARKTLAERLSELLKVEVGGDDNVAAPATNGKVEGKVEANQAAATDGKVEANQKVSRDDESVRSKEGQQGS